MSNQQLLDLIIDKFDGSIVEDNKWRVTGSNGNHYWVEWHPFHKHYSCGCKGYSFRKTCRHIKELSKKFKDNLGKKKGKKHLTDRGMGSYIKTDEIGNI